MIDLKDNDSLKDKFRTLKIFIDKSLISVN